jgi:hypothetical protein
MSTANVIDPTWFDPGSPLLTTLYPPVFPWKGKTFAQITTFLQRNKNSNTAFANSLLPNPVTRLYRREIASTPLADATNCSERVAKSIRELDQPGGSLVLPLGDPTPGLPGVVDPLLPNDTTHMSAACLACNNTPDNCQTSSTDSFNVCFTDESKARRRCRSSGMVKKQFVLGNNNDNAYFTDTKQFLTSRNRLFSQNQFNYLRTGSSVVVPGSALAVNNTYSANGLSHCPQYSISAVQGNNKFNYLWIDGSTYTITIDDGTYSIETFQANLVIQMTTLGHYFINPVDGTLHYLILFTYDTLQGRVILQVQPPSTYSSYNYYNGGSPAPWAGANNVPQVHFYYGGLPEALGFLYNTTLPASPQTTTYVSTAPNQPLLLPNYVSVVYKPSNPRFAQQGGVSSSTYAARIKYETVNTAAAATGAPNFGTEVANELAYGVPFVGYTVKDKRGFPNTMAPVIMPSGEMRSCQTFIYRYS